jgi:adenylate kinase family enzyme
VPARVRVVGVSGSGKTTLARTLAARLAVPHLELDSVHHRAGWRPASDEEWALALEEFVAAAPAGWVVDGSYTSRPQGALAAVDTVVWLDLPRRTVMARVARRTAARMLTRRELWNGNREDWRSLLRRDPTENILLWTWTRHAVVRQRNEPEWERHRDGAHGVRWVRLRTPREVRRWLEDVAP